MRGAFNAFRLLEVNFDIKKIILVDPFFSEGLMYPLPSNFKESSDYQKIEFNQSDGLSFLLSRKKESGNVITGALDYTIIPNKKYMLRLAEEIYRVVPRGGIYISLGSGTEFFAKEIFPKNRLIDQVSVFEK